MNWTFGIITTPQTSGHLAAMINSIHELNIPENNYEIVVIGDADIGDKHNLRHYDFDETIRPAWITRKKNIIANVANFNNIVLSHDHFRFYPNWYAEFEKFGGDWDVCMNQILNLSGSRFRDWLLWMPNPVDYADHTRTREMYVSGSYYCIKKDFALKHPLDERLGWCEGEDVEWSLRVRNFWNYRCNPNSIVQALKEKQ